MEIREIMEEDIDSLAELVADFRVVLKSFKGINSEPNVISGKAEIKEYVDAGFPVFVAKDGENYCGYIVCRVDEPCVWVESIYVCPKYRHQGIASLLFKKAEELAADYGEETVFNYVHPNNEAMISFLRKNGYTVLNLIEIRKPYKGEKLTTSIKVGNNEFDY